MTKVAARDNSHKIMFSSIHPLIADVLGYDLLALRAFAKVGTMGHYKYDIPYKTRLNYMLGGKNGLEYLDCLCRHVREYQNGEVFDPESGLPHLYHALWNVSVFITFTKLERCEPVNVPEHIEMSASQPTGNLFRDAHMISFLPKDEQLVRAAYVMCTIKEIIEEYFRSWEK
jgi:hypothetical protein